MFFLRNLSLWTLAFSLLYSHTISADTDADAEKQAKLAALAIHRIAPMIGQLMQFADLYDLSISGSEASCFNLGFKPNSISPQLSSLKQHQPIGELFIANHCHNIAGQRFYADSHGTELFIFNSQLEQQALSGTVEICPQCFMQKESQLYIDTHYSNGKFSFRFNNFYLVEREIEQSYTWQLQGGLSIKRSSCSIEIETINTLQELQLITQSASEWSEQKSSPNNYLRGELMLSLSSGDKLLMRFAQEKLWINEQAFDWQDILAVENNCLETTKGA